METVLPSEFKRAMVLVLDGAPYIIEELHQSGTAQTKHKLHTRLRNLKAGHTIDRVFAENERVTVAHLQTRRVTYSYSQGDTHVFLDAETFEELDLNDKQLGERRWFLKENEEYKALYLEGVPLDIVLPPQIPLQVVETAPPVRGSSDTAWKEAKLETGLAIMVPLFIAKGETIRVDTASKKYAGKQND
ncbi:MAG: elongation factor P [Limisphaerales bacterium]